MRSITVPMIIWLPILVGIVTYELTKFHGVKGWLKANTDFYGVTQYFQSMSVLFNL